MKKSPVIFFLFFFCCAASGHFSVQLSSGQEPADLADQVIVIKLTSDDFADSRRILEWEQLVAQADKDKAKAVVFDLDVKGAIPWNSQERILDSLSKLSVPTIAFVNSSATGAGALIAVGSDVIYMAPNGIIGGAGVSIPDFESAEAQKRELAQQLSLLKARARNLAKVKGRRPKIVEAFIDSELEIKYGEKVISEKGDILTLTASEAVQLIDGEKLLAKDIARDLEGLVEKENLESKRLELTPRNFAQQQNRARLRRSGSGEKSENQSDEDLHIFGKRTGKSFQDQIVVLEVGEDALSSGKARFEFMERTLKKAQLDGAAAVVFDIDTPGGYAWYTQGLILNSLQDVSVPTYSFVNTRAESAGAIVAIGTDHIYMRPAATIGSALVISGTGADLPEALQSKTTQMMISVVRNIAEIKGHNPDVAEAFVSREKEVKIGGSVIHPKGEVLNLNTIRATEKISGRPVLAKGIANSLEDLVRQEGLEGEIVTAEALGMEKFAHLIQKFSFILIIIGIAGVYLEMQTPGFALPGILAMLSFALFFFGNHLAGNLAGYELAVLFVLGLILIAVEIFLFPGTMIPALIGGALVVTSLGFALVDRVDLEWKWDGLPGSESWLSLLKGGFYTVAGGLVGGVALILALMKYLPETRLGGLLILKEAVPGGASIDGQMEQSEDHGRVSYLGWEGESTTDLLPAGKGRFRGKLLDVVSEGEFIPKDSLIVVSKHEGSRVVVRKLKS